MTIYSWNMLFRNKRLAEALAFVRESDADIFCLQEVPGEFLEELKKLPCHVAAAPEVDRLYAGVRSTQYVVILSRFPIKRHGRVPLPYWEPHLPWRARFVVCLFVQLRIWALGVGNRHAVYADLETPRGAVRVFNIHLPLATPAWREEEFELAMAELDPAVPAIVCGDFNTLEKPHVTPLSWLLGGTLGDMLLARRERSRVEALFAEHGFANPLRGARTQVLSQSQLDHILVSPHFSTTTTSVLPERCGSDHHPIRVEVSTVPARGALDHI